MRLAFGLFTAAGALALLHCSSLPDTCHGAECEAVPDGSTAEGGTESGADVVQPPVGCDPAADPRDAPKCVVSEFGVFVDATGGSDGNAGTRDAPVKSITAGLSKLGGKSRVYVCEGTYAEHVKLTSAVSLYGGFACGGWTYSGTKAKVTPADAGYALEVADTKADFTVADLAFLAPNATTKGQSSIAAFVHNASKVFFVRSELEAGIAKEGEDGAPGTTGAPTTGDLKGNAASGITPGLQKTCTCSSGGTSTGGGGGAPTGAGAAGLPSLGGATPLDGAPGLGNTGCVAAEPNGSGNNGADATNAADGAKVTALGALDATGWKPQAGTAGPSGAPGQGGGGGGGRDVSSAGGGGACGGCGGSGGKPGGGGGASVALLVLDTTVVLRASKLTANAAGAGGKGGAKGTGAAGGTSAAGVCLGGDGGRGGDGGTGSGGAGGVSAAVLHKGAPPTNDGSTLTPGAKGAPGIGGSPANNDGPDGQTGDIVVAPQ